MTWLRVIGPLIALVALLLVQGYASLNIMSAMRAYVADESLWSKAQKDAVVNLTQYAQSREEADYLRYVEATAVTSGSSIARRELDKASPDYAKVRQGFIDSGSHPADIDGMIALYERFRDVGFMAKGIAFWAEADTLMRELDTVATEMRRVITGGEPVHTRPYLDRIQDIDARLTPIERAFSATLGEASRQTGLALTVANLAAGLVLVLLAVSRTSRLMRQREEMQMALRTEQHRAQATLSAVADGVITVDTQARVDYLNPVAEKLTGWSLPEARGKPLHEVFAVVDEKTRDPVDGRIDRVLADGHVTDHEGDVVLAGRHGPPIAIDQNLAPIRERDGGIVGAVLAFQDKRREREYVSRLSHLASHDMLTGLINRGEFEERLQRLVTRTRNNDQHALLYLDLDQFKLINDTGGHAAGDELLRQISVSLRPKLREGDALARLGDDEFGVLLECCPAEAALRIAQSFLEAISNLRFVWQGRTFRIGVSIGLVNFRAGRTTVSSVLAAADAACHVAKSKGRDSVQVYRPGDHDVGVRQGEIEWVHRINEAFEENRFSLYAQPILDLRAGADGASSFEVLLRMRNEHDDLVDPGAFIPAAERYNLMPAIDRWVVRTAFDAIRRRIAQNGDAGIDCCAINLSGESLGDDQFLEFLRDEFARSGVPYRLICFEITETTAVTSLSKAAAFITTLRELGCRFAIDDFGVGMSSFAYLKHLPVDFLKIDGSFVRNMLDDPVDHALVETICRIGNVMGMKVIAEAVENKAVLDALRIVGVDFAQGYGIAMPELFAVRERRMGPRRSAAD